MTRVLVFGDSNSWGYPPNGEGPRFDPDIRWPQVMATTLGVEVIEDCLPGRTTRLDDPELLGPSLAHATNGLLHLPAALAAQSPVDHLVLMLGTNDLKHRFDQSAGQIGESLTALVSLARAVGGRRAGWDDLTPPPVTVIVPVPLGAMAMDPAWERSAEWVGGYEKSRALAQALPPMDGVAVIEAGTFTGMSRTDPIHMDADGQRRLGQGIATTLAL